MKNLKDVSRIFLLKSKALSLSCIGSILIAILLIISMLNLTINAETSYKNKIRSMYGDIDVIATYEGYSGIPETTLKRLKALKEVDQISAGYFDPDFKIDENPVYLVGSDNSALIKSRYHYINNLSEDEIAINSVLADSLQYKVNDIIDVGGVNFRVKEIIRDVGSANSLFMAILNQTAFVRVHDMAPEINFILIGTDDRYQMNYIVKCIRDIDGRLNLNVTEEDEWYKDAVKSFSIFIRALAVCVILVTGLFVASTMRRFIYKYNHDMAIIRAIGGSTNQVRSIFRYLVIIINLIGCTGGFLIALLLNKIILGMLNQRIQLTEGHISFFFFRSLGATVLIFILLTLILLLSIQKSLKILPLEAFQENELNKIGKGNKKAAGNLLFRLCRLFGRDTYITMKTMLSRLKENFLITGTIMVIVVISFIGGSLSKLIQKNNEEYLQREYLTDMVVTFSSPILYEDIAGSYEQLKDTEGVNAAIILAPRNTASIHNDELSFMLADMNTMQKQGIVDTAVTGSNRIVLSETSSAKLKAGIGDNINIMTPTEYSYDPNGMKIGVLKEPYEVQMCIAGILPDYILAGKDAFIDMNASDFFQKSNGVVRIYVSGNLDRAEQVLNQIKGRYPEIKWSNYEEVKRISNKTLKDRFIMFEAVVSILVLIAGFGWVNAIRHTILSRADEYRILRMHGMTIKRLRKMLIKHILIYLITGLAAGEVGGMAVLLVLTYLEGGATVIVINFGSLALITAFLVILNLLLIPDIVKVSKAEIIMNE